MGIQISAANAAAATAELRALSCCAGDCDGPVSLPAARGCCQVTATASGPAEAAAGHVLPTPVACAPLVVRDAPMTSTSPHPDHIGCAGTGPPTFLAHRHLLR